MSRAWLPRAPGWPAVALASGLLVALLLGLGPSAAGGGAPDPFKALDLLRPGRQEPAKDFRAAALQEGSVGLADYRGEVVLLNFWATWCPPCRDEMPAMERLFQRYRHRGFAVVAVSLDANAALVPPFLRKYGLTFPVAHDPRMAVAERYGVRALPATFLIDRTGEVRAVAFGPRDWDSAPAHAIIEALVGSSPAPTGPPDGAPR